MSVIIEVEVYGINASGDPTGAHEDHVRRQITKAEWLVLVDELASFANDWLSSHAADTRIAARTLDMDSRNLRRSIDREAQAQKQDREDREIGR